jgi:hypothetical protein
MRFPLDFALHPHIWQYMLTLKHPKGFPCFLPAYIS